MPGAAFPLPLPPPTLLPLLLPAWTLVGEPRGVLAPLPGDRGCCKNAPTLQLEVRVVRMCSGPPTAALVAVS